jgi:hypothetical protein
MRRGNELLGSHPSRARLFFDCSVPYATSPIDEARCLVYNGVATWLSGSHPKGMELIRKGSALNPDIIEVLY